MVAIAAIVSIIDKGQVGNDFVSAFFSLLSLGISY